ncbi:MAG: replicative DNA helicase [Ruminococcus sp.]|uniref:replicative DNA helicase n=1 Tax=Ruminococcus sp. TaxID=41978 RepID=UPI00292D96BC|nr:replicative DNA helicase [uncultured Ruminococcus sp.]MBQ1897612.1 replicative DNA helicase [Ruminococcus sp.]MBQ4238715.1 replicative DNA helicase [Ruminococcus sp.]MBQ6413619.1 replicative DNA helicase [Ruminococcus sp.]
MPDNNNTTLSGPRMPYSLEAEQAVLGAVLMEPDAISRVAEVLPSSEYFYLANHRTIYAVMLSMFTSGQPVDQITVLEALKTERDFDDATGKTYLYQLAQNCPSIANVENYARIVRDKYDVRALMNAARDIIEDSTDGEMEPQMLIDSAEQKIFDIRRGKDIQGLQRLDEVLYQTFDRLDMLTRKDDSVKPISTGIGDLDNVITGLNRSDLILLAARPGMGKTSFALNIARNVSVVGKKTVAFFSLEMTKEQLASRLLSSEALVGGTKLRTGRILPDEWKRLIGAGDILKNAPMYLDDTPGITVPEMKAKLRRLKRPDLVVIDYLQLMSTGRRDGNRVQEISELTRNLKILAKEINVPVICLSQLSRASEQRQDHRPQLSDLRDSGSIEQDADIVLFLYRDGYYDREKGAETAQAAIDQNSGECIVAKNRHGETTTVKLHWQGEFMRFTGQERSREE